MEQDTETREAEAPAIAWTARLGAHLEASRRRSGLRRLDLANQLGVSEETIRLWERGAVQPSADRLARLIAVLSLEMPAWSAPARSASDLPPLARRLRDERDARGVTQAAIAEQIGVPQATYAGWETGRVAPSPPFHSAIAALLGLREADVGTLCATPFVVEFSEWPAFGQFVGARRQELRLPRAALAATVGVSQSTVVSWELGYRVPASRHLATLAGALGVDVGSLASALPRRRAASALGELILARQRELGLRSADVAELTGTTESTVSRWVHGVSQPGARNLRRLADALKVPYAHVFEVAGAVT